MALTTVKRSVAALPNDNLFINGDFEIWQRGFSFENHSMYYADRWMEYHDTDDAVIVTRESFDDGQTEVPGYPRYFLRASLTAGTTGTLNDFRQFPEDCRRFAGRILTHSYWIRGSVPCTINNRRGRARYNETEYSDGFGLQNINVTTSWQKVVDTFEVSPIPSGVVIDDTYSRLDVTLGWPVNTTVNLDIAMSKLEYGEYATPFVRRDPTIERMLCKRYYNSIIRTGGVAIIGTGYCGDAVTGRGFLIYEGVNMRATPTVEVSGTYRILSKNVYNGISTLTIYPSLSHRTIYSYGLPSAVTTQGEGHVLTTGGSEFCSIGFNSEIY